MLAGVVAVAVNRWRLAATPRLTVAMSFARRSPASIAAPTEALIRQVVILKGSFASLRYVLRSGHDVRDKG